MTKRTPPLIFILILVVTAAADPQRLKTTEPIFPIIAGEGPQTDKKFLLGKKLFQDPRLSKSNTVSCMSCHTWRSGSDGKKVSLGDGGVAGDINAPTVFNSRYNFRQFWDGRAVSLEDQIDGPLHNPKEMNTNWSDVLKKIEGDPTYVQMFNDAFSARPSVASAKAAITAFEMGLVTPNAKFDRYLQGETEILSSLEKRGYEKFKSYGCIACHQGINVGGNMFQTMGVMGDYFKNRGTPLTKADYGRYNVTGNQQDKFVFKVPGLRNVELTAPYFHDGSAATLEKAVTVMARYQLGRSLSAGDTSAIVAFLKTLTGDNPLKGD